MSGRSRTLRIEILGDAKQAVAAFDDVAQGADGLGSKIGGAAKVGGAALLGLGAVAVGLGGAAYKMGETFDEAFDAIRISTGATGEELAGLEESFKNVVANVPTDFDTAAGAIAGLNTLTGATGETLEDLASNVLNASRLLGEDGVSNAEAFGRAMAQWNTPAEDGAALMDDLFKLTQDYGIGLGQLIGQLNTYGPVMKNAGFSTEETAELMARLNAEGISWSRISPGLNASFRKWAAAGKDPREELGRVIEAMQGASTEAEALTLATETFGAEGAQRLTTAIRNGTFSLEGLGEALGDNAGLVAELADETDDLSQKWQLLKNRALVALEPVASGVFNLAGSLMDNLLPATETVLPAIVSGIEGIAQAFQEGGISGALGEIGSLIGAAFGTVDWGSLAGTVVDGLLGALDGVTSLTGDLASWFWDAVKGIDWTGIGETVATGIVGAASSVASFAGDVANWLLDTFTGVDWSGVGGSLVDGVLDGVKAVADFGSRVATWISEQFSNADWSGLGTTLVDGLLDGVQAVVDFGSRVISWISEQFNSVDWSDLGTTLIDGLLDGLTAVVDFGSRVVTWISEQFSSVDWGELGTTLVDGLLDGISAVTDFGSRAAGWISEQFSDVDWSGLGETISSGLGSALSKGTELAQGLATQVQNFDWSSLGETISGGLSSAGDAIGGWFDLSGIQSQIETLRPVLDPFIGILRDNLGTTLGNLREALAGLNPLWAALTDLFKEIEPVLKPLAAVIGGVLLAALGAIVLQISNLAVVLSEALVIAIDVATAAIKSVTGVIQVIAAVVEGVVKIVKNLLEGDFSGAWEAAKEMVSGVIDGIGTYLSGMPALALEYIGAFVSAALGFLGNLLSEGVAKAGEVVAGIAGALADLMVGALGHVSGFVLSALGFLGDLVSDGAAKAGELLSGIMDALLTLFIDGPLKIWEFVQAGLTELGKLVIEGAKKAGELPGEILEALGDLGTLLLQSGKDVVQGLIDGMGSMLGAVGEKAGEIVGAVTGAITSGFGIFSPSRVMHQFGEDVDQGFIDGMEAKRPQVEITAAELAKAVVEGVKNNVERLPELLADTGVAFALEIDKMRVAAEEALILARIRGDSEEEIAKFQADLDTLQLILEAWAEDTGNTIEEAYRFALTQEQRDAAVKSYEALLRDLEGLASGETLKGLQQELANLLDLQQIAEQAGQFDLAAHYAELAEAKAEELRMAGELMATPIVQGMAEKIANQETVDDWLHRLALATGEGAPKFIEDLQQQLEGLDKQIAAAILNPDVPEEVLLQLREQRDLAAAELEQTMRDLADAAVNGLMDPAVLKEMGTAGKAQLEAYMAELVGEEAAKELIGSVGKMSTEAVEELKKVFAEAPEIAGDFIDDIVKGLEDGSIEVEDAMELLAKVPSDELIPALEDMSETYQKLIVQAILDGNWDLVASLQTVKGVIDDLTKSMNKGATAAGSYTQKVATLPKGSSGGSLAGGLDHSAAIAAVADARKRLEEAIESGELSNHGGMTKQEFDAFVEDNRRRAAEKERKERQDAQVGMNPRNMTVLNNITVQVDGEPVAESVDKVNTRDLAVSMGPI